MNTNGKSYEAIWFIARESKEVRRVLTPEDEEGILLDENLELVPLPHTLVLGKKYYVAPKELVEG